MDNKKTILAIENNERLAFKKLYELKRLVMILDKEELDLLLSDLDDLISLFDHSVKVEKNYDYYNVLKKALKKKEPYDISRF